jgi:hypothetical protein
VAEKYVRQLFTSRERLPRLVLTLHLGKRGRDDLRLSCLWNDDHAIGVAEDEIAGLDARAGHFTGTSIATTLPRPFESSGPMPAANTGNFNARIARTSRVSPSMTAPAAPRACAAVESSSPHGAIRPDVPHAKSLPHGRAKPARPR